MTTSTIRCNKYPVTLERVDGQQIDFLGAVSASAALGLAGYETDFEFNSLHGNPTTITLFPLESAKGDRTVNSNLRKAGYRRAG